jgi:hypothetical protein
VPFSDYNLDPGDVISILGDAHVFYETEMRTGGSFSWVDSNPGNIVQSQEAEGYGAYPGKHNDIFAIFPSDQIGFDAIKKFLLNPVRSSKSVREMMKIYAPAGHGGNDPETYAQQVADRIGVSVDTLVNSLSEDQLTTFAKAVQDTEGWILGQTFPDNALPAAVMDWLTQFSDADSRTQNDQPFAKRGSSGPGVKNLQHLLNQWNPGLQLGEDGNFGPSTEQAVKDFQTAKGLTADGIAGHKTWVELTA